VRYLGIYDPVAAPKDPEHINRDERALECWIAAEALTLKPPSTEAEPSASALTPLQKRIRAELAQVEDAKRAETTWPKRVRNAEVGVTTTVVGPGASWPCASSIVALKELMKWHKASLAEPDSAMNDLAFKHLTDTLMRTKSITVEPRERVKILENEPSMRKISVIDHKGTYRFDYMAATAQGCWVAAEAVTR
jgi:hypothetical protein